MINRPRNDDAGDSDELQALFDSIAANPQGEPAAGSASCAPFAPASGGSGDDGDNDELQALFDAVAEQASAGGQRAPAAAAAAGIAGAAAQPGVAAPMDAESVFNRLGQLTRQVHDSLRELGLDEALQVAAEAIPDARQRLAYIARTTEEAASKVLNATDLARPIQSALGKDATQLAARWDELYAGRLSPEAFRELSTDTRGFLDSVTEGCRETDAQLHEIMMAQDFQDLTGQVIKRVVDLAHTLETQLLQVLLEAAPPGVRVDRPEGLLNGPVVNAEGRKDVLTSQAQVDDLLESLGF